MRLFALSGDLVSGDRVHDICVPARIFGIHVDVHVDDRSGVSLRRRAKAVVQKSTQASCRNMHGKIVRTER